jgi:hypothetical protein
MVPAPEMHIEPDDLPVTQAQVEPRLGNLLHPRPEIGKQASRPE